MTAFSFVVASSTLNATARGEDLKPAHVPADAKWVLHVDLDQLLDTKLAQTVRERRPEIVEGIRQWVQQQYGIDTRNDLRSVTMFSKDYEEYTGSVVIQAKYDPQKVQQQLQQAEKLQKTESNGLTFYTFQVGKHASQHGQQSATSQQNRNQQTSNQQAGNRQGSNRQSSGEASSHDKSGGKEMTVVLLDNDTIVLGSSVENAKNVVALLRGEQPSLQGQQSQLINDVAKDAIFYGSAIKLENIKKQDLPMPVLKQHKTVSWVFGERDGKLYEKATLVGQSEGVAEQMEKVVEGFLAYQKLWAADSETLTKLVEAAEVSRSGDEIKVDWEADTETVLAGLDDVMKRFQDMRMFTAR